MARALVVVFFGVKRGHLVVVGHGNDGIAGLEVRTVQ